MRGSRGAARFSEKTSFPANKAVTNFGRHLLKRRIGLRRKSLVVGSPYFIGNYIDSINIIIFETPSRFDYFPERRRRRRESGGGRATAGAIKSTIKEHIVYIRRKYLSASFPH